MLSCRLVERDAQNPRTSQIVAEALRKADRGLVLVVTGAGVSAASGLPLFRGTDPDAIWNREVTEIGTVDFFRRDPVAWWQWFRQSFAGLLDARPNPAHHALAALERWQLARGGADAGSDFLLVTQNVDTLHEQAGSKRLVKVHGTADRLRCSRPGCRLGAPGGSFPAAEADFARFDETPARQHIPRCPECGALVRAHALLFDEFYDEHVDYGFGEVRRAIEQMGLVLFVGTSFSVGVTDLVLRGALAWHLPVISIDPGAAGPPARGVTMVREPAEALLPAVVRELG